MDIVDRRSSRLDGHVLVAKGAPFGKGGARAPRRRYWHGVGGRGRALCTCGDTSPVVDSVAERLDWHRRHKNSLRPRTQVDQELAC